MAAAAIEPLDRWSKKDLGRFVRVPWSIYAGDPSWVPPLVSDEMTVLGASGPFFEHADGALFMAMRDGRPVGRIAALQDGAALEKDVGRIGFFECIDDRDVAAALFEQAEKWLREHGFSHVRGPISPNLVWAAPGVFVEGEPGMPNVFMPYTPSWYPQLWGACGYSKEVDTIAMRLAVSSAFAPENRSRLESLESEGYRFRRLSKKTIASDLHAYVRIRNETYEHSTPFGFSRVTPHEEEFIVRMFGPSLEADLIVVVEKSGEIVAMVIGFHDLGPMLQALDGRLGPIRLIKGLLAKRRSTRGRVADILTLPGHQNKKVAIAAAHLVMRRMHERGISDIEGSWILETNTPSMKAAQHFGGQEYRRYRIYRKELN